MASALWARLTGDRRRAAAVYLRSGRMEKAAAMLEKAGEPDQAARLWLRSGNEKRALALLGTLHPEIAGQLLSEEDLDHLAVNFFERAGAFWQAAECARRLGRALRAGRLFEEAGAFEQAAASYAQAGENGEVLRVWKRWSEELALGGNHAESQRIDLSRAKMLATLGRSEEAAEILEALRRWSGAARLWERSRRWQQAISAHLEAGHAVRAVALLDEVEDDLPADLRARVLAAASRHKEAAQVLQDAGDVSGAIRALEAAGEFADAARRAEERGSTDQAMDLWTAANRPAEVARLAFDSGDIERAATIARDHGENAQAATYYRAFGDPLRAAQESLKADRVEEAIADLLEIEEADSDYPPALRLLVPLLINAGRYAEALRRLESLGPKARTTSVDYWRARVREGLGEIESAIDSYRTIVAQRPRFLDARARLRVLEGRDHSAARATAKDYLRPGEVLQGRYKVEEEVGRGAMSRVYRARDVVRRHWVAIKVMSKRFADLENAEQRLVDEVRLCRRLHHPNVVRYLEYGNVDGRQFVIMELLEGEPLSAQLAREGSLSVGEVQQLGIDLALGLSAAHRENIIHRDLKPANIMISGRGAKIMDFGIASSEPLGLSLAGSAQVFGSPSYMSPEQIQGFVLDGRSDLYSLGVVLYECLAGTVPFTGVTAMAVSLKHLQDTPPELKHRHHQGNEGLVTLVNRLLSKSPDERFATAEQVGFALRELQDSELP